jgi:hypothetical protein
MIHGAKHYKIFLLILFAIRSAIVIFIVPNVWRATAGSNGHARLMKASQHDCATSIDGSAIVGEGERIKT